MFYLCLPFISVFHWFGGRVALFFLFLSHLGAIGLVHPTDNRSFTWINFQANWPNYIQLFCHWKYSFISRFILIFILKKILEVTEENVSTCIIMNEHQAHTDGGWWKWVCKYKTGLKHCFLLCNLRENDTLCYKIMLFRNQKCDRRRDILSSSCECPYNSDV